MRISGILEDDYGIVDGATIIVLRDGKRTNVAVISDQNGQFEIVNDQIKSNDKVEIRYLGNKTIIDSVNRFTGETKNIKMEEDIDELDDVIVTATVGKKPNELVLDYTPVKKTQLNPVILFGILGIVTIGAIVLIIKKSK
jgi:hypothetical protein|tara:strand:+ start:2866 stop:3285 length:420 start_codon:yes stop_codon:yes gene_type:complete